jgi:hemerythrin-like domain-containing protein
MPTDRALEDPFEYLLRDHDRLDAILADAQARFERGESATEAFADFRAGLERHLQLEEEVIFPAYEARTGLTGGPTAVLRFEHALIREQLSDLAEMLRLGAWALFRVCMVRFNHLLAAHDLKEERVLYPSAVRLMDPSLRAALTEQLRAR